MKKTKYIMLYAAVGLFFAIACKKKNSEVQPPNQFTDIRDGNVYKTVTIGNQTWMAENLRYNVAGSDCYDDNSNNCIAYGKLYSWAQASTACPSNYKLPSDEDWKTLELTLGMNQAKTDLYCYNNEYRGTNQGTNIKIGGISGFNALLGGFQCENKKYFYIGTEDAFWSSTKDIGVRYYSRSLKIDKPGIRRLSYPDFYQCCVRCLLK
jgi:uncharacterized protein (TIGR02145 family)